MRSNGNGHANGYDAAPKMRFPLQRFGDIMLDGSQRYLVKGLIPLGGLIVVWGPPKCGKSFLVSDLSLHIALGREYRDRRVQQGTVIYITCEGQSGFPARIEAFRQHRMGEDEPPPPFYLLSTRLDLVDEADRLIQEIVFQLSNADPALVVIDTLNRSLTGSENSDEDMSAYILACDKLRERFKCAVIVIHHCGIEGTRPRGHTSLQGAVDAQIAVKKDENNAVEATVEYMKDGEDGARFLSRLQRVIVGEDEDGEDITSCVIEIADQFIKKEKRAPKRLSPSAALVLDSLRKTVNEHGEPSPGGNHMPSNVQVALIEAWRRTHYSTLGSDMPEASKRQDFYRGRQQLQAAAVCAIHERWAWIV